MTPRTTTETTNAHSAHVGESLSIHAEDNNRIGSDKHAHPIAQALPLEGLVYRLQHDATFRQ